MKLDVVAVNGEVRLALEERRIRLAQDVDGAPSIALKLALVPWRRIMLLFPRRLVGTARGYIRSAEDDAR